MIGYLEGKIIKREDDRILLLVNHVGYEILLPAFVMESIRGTDKGEEIPFYIYYHQTDRQPKPVLIGFGSEEEKAFFQLFISVDAIGPLKAAKAMEHPVSTIARAIETKDVTFLATLKGIGKRTAQKIVAALHGKAVAFVGEGESDAAAPRSLKIPGKSVSIQVVIDQVVPDSGAHRAGLRGIDYRNRRLGDIIVSVDGKRVKNIGEFIRLLQHYEIGGTLNLEVMRGERVRNVSVVVMDIS